MAAHQHPYQVSLSWITSLIMSGFLVIAAMISVSQAEVTLDGSMGPAEALVGPDFVIGHDKGQVRGNNLFHSFGEFNVMTGESATFTGPGTLENVIGRVTGGNSSFIDGSLRSTIPSANLFLLNPAGVLFGPNASVDVMGSFHASTADFLRFEDGAKFYADPAIGDVLTVAPPEAFGFLSENPAGITIDQSLLQVQADATISVVGGDITVTGGTLEAPGGRINIASVASPGEVIPNVIAAPSDLDVTSFERLGEIVLTQAAEINAGGPGGGTVVIRGGRLTLDQSSVLASAKETGGGALGEGIDIQVVEDVVLDNSSEVGTNVFRGVDDKSGGVRIKADRLEVRNFSRIDSNAYNGNWVDDGGWIYYPPSTGDSGNIEVTTNSLLLDNGALIRAGTGASRDDGVVVVGGDILITTGSLEVRDGSTIYAYTQGSYYVPATANGGDIDVTADTMHFSNVKYPGYVTGITSQTGFGTGKAGDVTVKTNSLQMEAGTEISSATFHQGLGGNVNVTVEGTASIEGTKAKTAGGADIFSGIAANTKDYYASGRGGNLAFTAWSLEMNNEASIQATTTSWGDAGDAVINVGSLELKNSSWIGTGALNSWGGDAGDLTVTANSILISGPESSLDPFGEDFTGLSTIGGQTAGSGGDLTVTATDNLTLTSRGSMTSSTLGPDPGGNLIVNTGTLQVLDGSNLTASAFGSGDGGTVNIQADTVRVSGVHPEPFVNEWGLPYLAVSSIVSQAADQGGSGGSVIVNARVLELLDGGRLSTITFGTGNAGNLTVTADSVLMSGINEALKAFWIANGFNPKWAGSGVLAGTDAALLGDSATGNGGRIQIAARDLGVEDGAYVASETTTPGAGGRIELTADNVTLAGGAFISAVSRNSAIAGKAGDISITADRAFTSNGSSVTTAADQAQGGDITITSQNAQLDNGSVISAKSSGLGDAGNISITVTDTFLTNDSSITTEAVRADGGNIQLNTQYMVCLATSEMTASVGGGPDTVGGNITIDPEYVILDSSKIIANAFEGRGGNIKIVAGVFLATPDSVLDASSALGVDGEIDISAPITNVSASMKLMPDEFLSAAKLLRESCDARLRGGKYSSFIIRGRDGLPPEPAGLLPSPQ